MAFASATAMRGFGRSTDPPGSSSSTFDLDSPRYDRRERTRDKDLERDGDRTRDTRSGTLNGRRAAKEDNDGWTPVKPRKSFGHEDAERYSRRNQDRDRERAVDSGRDGRDRPQRSFEVFNREREREADGEKESGSRRNGVPRGRNEASWFKERETHPTKDGQPKDPTREREWRDRNRGNDRVNERGHDRGHERNERGNGWTRGGPAEKDPEWMDTPAAEEKQAHTAEDFQRWKERMKAGGTPAEDKPNLDSAASTAPAPREAAPSKEAQPASTSLALDSEMDKFFGMWNDPKSKANQQAADLQMPVLGKEPGKATVGRASRFTSFFSPAEEVPLRQPVEQPEMPVPAAASKDASSEDKEGFQRILQMLGGMSLGAEKPASQPSQPPRLRSHHQGPPPPEQFAPAHTFPRDEEVEAQPYRESSDETHVRSSAHMDHLLSMPAADHGANHMGPNRDNEFLLGLMHQGQTNVGDDGTGSLNLPPGFGRAPGPQLNSWMATAAPPGLPAKAPVAIPPGFSESNAVPGLQNRRVDGPQPAPTILQRPPGFEQVIPGWPAGQPPPGQPRPLLPPPGFGQDATAGHPFPPFLPPPNGTPFFRNPIGPGAPPGMAPPSMPPPLPSFFGMNIPPPGYPPIPFQQDPMMGLPGLGDPRARAGPPPAFDPFGGDAGNRGRGAPPGEST